ncbi:unnamed protein product [Soboliphyme baturini]|uniref:Ragulator complex protein LAMTOR5 n=1 Tax=Soboliphyme baturini TaxID=241478 RepID=A0A183II97_9BILA|nr:unnamed protein product [Soboliphyme baturini]
MPLAGWSALAHRTGQWPPRARYLRDLLREAMTMTGVGSLDRPTDRPTDGVAPLAACAGQVAAAANERVSGPSAGCPISVDHCAVALNKDGREIVAARCSLLGGGPISQTR